jgi:hypothetical protein
MVLIFILRQKKKQWASEERTENGISFSSGFLFGFVFFRNRNIWFKLTFILRNLLARRDRHSGKGGADNLLDMLNGSSGHSSQSGWN